MHAIKTNYYFYVSVVFHLLTLGTIGLYFKATALPLLGHPEFDVLNAYLYHEQQISKPIVSEKNLDDQPQKQEIKQNNSLALEKKIIKKKLINKNRQSTEKKFVKTATISKGEQTELLVALLHNAIQQQQHYPAAAQQMERQGRVKVSFLLYKDGRIAQLRLLQSSGTASLDQAALAAVSNAAPFKHVKRYLIAAQEFNIDVVFELS